MCVFKIGSSYSTVSQNQMLCELDWFSASIHINKGENSINQMESVPAKSARQVKVLRVIVEEIFFFEEVSWGLWQTPTLISRHQILWKLAVHRQN